MKPEQTLVQVQALRAQSRVLVSYGLSWAFVYPNHIWIVQGRNTIQAVQRFSTIRVVQGPNTVQAVLSCCVARVFEVSVTSWQSNIIKPFKQFGVPNLFKKTWVLALSQHLGSQLCLGSHHRIGKPRFQSRPDSLRSQPYPMVWGPSLVLENPYPSFVQAVCDSDLVLFRWSGASHVQSNLSPTPIQAIQDSGLIRKTQVLTLFGQFLILALSRTRKKK